MTPDLNKLKFLKIHRKKRIIRLNKGNKGKRLANYDLGVISLKKALITYNHMESLRKLIVRKLKGKSNKNQRNIKIIKSQAKVVRRQKRKKLSNANFNLRRNFCLGLTKKPLQVRMGKGKGNPVDWVYPCASNRILLEFSLMKKKPKKIKKILTKGKEKLPVPIKFIFSNKKRRVVKALKISRNKLRCIKVL